MRFLNINSKKYYILQIKRIKRDDNFKKKSKKIENFDLILNCNYDI